MTPDLSSASPVAEPEASLRQTRAEYVQQLVHQIVAEDMEILSTRLPVDPATQPLIVRGRLQRPGHELFEGWLRKLNRRGYTPLLRPVEDNPNEVELHVMPGAVPRTRSNPWVNLVLFLATVVSTLMVGALYSIEAAPDVELLDLFAQILSSPALLFSGWPFAATLLGILTAHEFGHYFAARYHKVDVTLPYFIPMPLAFGTLGAFIRLKEPVPDRRKLFDIGVAGPLAGLALAVPLLIIGLGSSEVTLPMPSEGAVLEGNSLLYYWAKVWVLGQPLPDPQTGLDVLMNDVTFAAWIGLLVTALNLLPLGQLDGGHTVFALFGRRARLINWAALAAMLLLGIAGLPPLQERFPFLVDVGWTGWFIWIVLINLLGGPFHPPALDDVTRLDGRRRILGYLMIVIFIVTFVPVPLRPL